MLESLKLQAALQKKTIRDAITNDIRSFGFRVEGLGFRVQGFWFGVLRLSRCLRVFGGGLSDLRFAAQACFGNAKHLRLRF